MKIENLFHFILISFLIISACNRNQSSLASPNEVNISLSVDSTAVELHDVRPDVLEYFRSDSINEKDWQSFFAIYPESHDPEMRDLQQPLKGIYTVKDSTILFVPKDKFEKDIVYFARCYSRKVLSKPSDIIWGGKLSEKTEPIELVFKR